MNPSASSCPNCGTHLQGKFCHTCGQKVIEKKERTVRHFIYQFLGSAFFLENNFLKNLWVLVSQPGRLSLDFIEARRKRWMPPFSLFLLINLFYFWYSPLTDLDLRLDEQVRQVHHAKLASYLVNKRLTERGVGFDEYAEQYNSKSSSYANSLVVLQLPVFASFLSLIYFRKKYFFIDHLIYALHFFSLVLLLVLVQSGLLYLFDLFKHRGNVWQMLSLGLLAIMLLYTFLIYPFLSLKKTYNQKWLHTAIAIIPFLLAFVATLFIYRTLLFLIIFTVT